MSKKLILSFLVVSACLNGIVQASAVIPAEDNASQEMKIKELTERLELLEKKLVQQEVKEKEKEVQEVKEKKQQQKNAEKFKISGYLRTRIDQEKTDKTDRKWAEHNSHMLSFIKMDAKIDDNMTATLYTEGKASLDTGDADNSNPEYANVTGLYFSFPYLNSNVDLGRFKEISPGANMLNTSISGMRLKFGEKVKTKVIAGRLKSNIFVSKYSKYSVFPADKSPFIYSIQTQYKVNPSLSTNLSYYNVSYGNNDYNLGELGLGIKLNDYYSINGQVVKSDLELPKDDDTEYKVFLKYRGMERLKPGSWGIYAGKLNIPYSASIDATNNWIMGKKAWRLGFEYVPVKNMTMSLQLDDREVIATGEKQKAVRLEIYQYF
ncbi:hypothetical protein [Anaerosinus massiliensis]|uniref:hypothetical protein n=1 Tax=Massilibacillus massiliensis TaxID=1806837 RepID=UPI0018FE69C9|nr:hypothetical protein [Massilibacillus massiliensis]